MAEVNILATKEFTQEQIAEAVAQATASSISYSDLNASSTLLLAQQYAQEKAAETKSSIMDSAATAGEISDLFT